jgi:hypothetical protein
MGGVFQDTEGGTWQDSDGGTWRDSGKSIGFIVREDGTGDFTSVLTALADPLINDQDRIECQGLWDDPDPGLTDGTAMVYNDLLTIVATGDARYPGYPVENPTHWRARKTTATESSVIEANGFSIELDGLDISHNGGASGVYAACVQVKTCEYLRIKNSVLHRTVDHVDELGYGVNGYNLEESMTIEIVNTQICH